MAKDNTFGFDELDKAFKTALKKFPKETDALLMAGGKRISGKTKADTPVAKRARKNKNGKTIMPGGLKKSWRVQKPKSFGKARVVRVMTSAPHGHLVEQGHRIVRGGRIRGKNGKERSSFNLGLRGIDILGKVEGKYMLEKAHKEHFNTFGRDADKMLDRLVKDLEV